MNDESDSLPLRQLRALRESWPEPRPEEVQATIDRLAVQCGEAPPSADDTIASLRHEVDALASALDAAMALVRERDEALAATRVSLAELEAKCAHASQVPASEAPEPTDAALEGSGSAQEAATNEVGQGPQAATP